MKRATHYDYLVIGGGVAGVTAAEEIRRRDSRGTILILSQESEPLYSRVLLPQYVRGKIERQKVYLRSLEQYAHHRIDYFFGEEVVAVNLDMRKVITSARKEISCDKMLITTGGTPRPWDQERKGSGRVFRLQTLGDADRLRTALEKRSGRALIVGGGFIGLEFIESAVTYGFETHVFLRGEKYFGQAFDDTGWQFLKSNFEQNGVHIHSMTHIREMTHDAGSATIVTDSGEAFRGDWIGVGIGLDRNVAVFLGSALEIGRGILVNQFLETNVPHVWAAGDITEFFDSISEGYYLIGNWTNAVMQGKVAGMNMAGTRTEFRAVPTYSITNLGLFITFVGETLLQGRMEDIIRVWPEDAAYERIFLKDGVIRGAVLINRFPDKIPLAALIEKKKILSDDAQAALREPSFHVSSLL